MAPAPIDESNYPFRTIIDDNADGYELKLRNFPQSVVTHISGGRYFISVSTTSRVHVAPLGLTTLRDFPRGEGRAFTLEGDDTLDFLVTHPDRFCEVSRLHDPAQFDISIGHTQVGDKIVYVAATRVPTDSKSPTEYRETPPIPIVVNHAFTQRQQRDPLALDQKFVTDIGRTNARENVRVIKEESHGSGPAVLQDVSAGQLVIREGVISLAYSTAASVRLAPLARYVNGLETLLAFGAHPPTPHGIMILEDAGSSHTVELENTVLYRGLKDPHVQKGRVQDMRHGDVGVALDKDGKEVYLWRVDDVILPYITPLIGDILDTQLQKVAVDYLVTPKGVSASLDGVQKATARRAFFEDVPNESLYVESDALKWKNKMGEACGLEAAITSSRSSTQAFDPQNLQWVKACYNVTDFTGIPPELMGEIASKEPVLSPVTPIIPPARRSGAPLYAGLVALALVGLGTAGGFWYMSSRSSSTSTANPASLPPTVVSITASAPPSDAAPASQPYVAPAAPVRAAPPAPEPKFTRANSPFFKAAYAARDAPVAQRLAVVEKYCGDVYPSGGASGSQVDLANSGEMQIVFEKLVRPADKALSEYNYVRDQYLDLATSRVMCTKR